MLWRVNKVGSGTHLTLVVEQNDPPTDPGLALIGHNAESGTCKLITAGQRSYYQM